MACKVFVFAGYRRCEDFLWNIYMHSMHLVRQLLLNIIREKRMKLKTKLKISFCAIILLPLVLFTGLLFGFGGAKMRSVERSVGKEFSIGDIISSLQTYSESAADVLDEIRDCARTDSAKLTSFVYLQELNDRLAQRLSYLVIRRDGELYYQGNQADMTELIEQLPPFGDDAGSSGAAIYLGGSLRVMIRQLDVAIEDGTQLSVDIITPVSAFLPGLRSTILETLGAVILVLVLTSVLLTLWIYRSINTPIARLREATDQIAQGDLDFTLEAEGDDEISDLTRDFEKMRRRLKESEEEKRRYDKENRELISNISHDLKTPITSIKGYVEGILDGVADTPEKMDRYIKTIYNKANDMDRLINELTFYSRIDTNRIPYHFTRLNVTEYFEDCAEEVSLDLQERGIGFTYENTVDPSTMIVGDPEQLKRVINNIIGNSVKYIEKPGGNIALRILDAGDFIQVELEDNGKGIETKDLPYIFDRFYRTDESRNSEQGGNGIGLSIVRKIIEDHSGRIWALSKIGRGTTICFVIRKHTG